MVDSLSLAGKTAIVTAPGPGLGRAEALAPPTPVPPSS